MYTSIYMHWLNNNVRNFIISRKPFHMIFKKMLKSFNTPKMNYVIHVNIKTIELTDKNKLKMDDSMIFL